MSNTIQHYSFNDTSSYGKSVKLNTSIEELNRKQTEERKGSFAVVAKDDAATIEISQLARAMYDTSVKEPEKGSDTREVQNSIKEKEAGSYAGLSNVERELKELEDYIASHPADTSIDLMRNGSLVQQAGRNTANLVDEALILAENEYTKAFEGVAEGFADFSMKITYGDYSGNDVSVNDLDLGALDEMEEMYWSYREKIQSGYTGDEREKYLNKLDEVYNAVFEEKILNPVRSAYNDKLTFFKPDSEETVRSIRAASASKETLNEMISGYVANQTVNKKQYNTLLNGTETFFDMADNKSIWHDTAAVRDILTASMNAYSSVREINVTDNAYLSAKSAADEIAKKISDKYAENLEYKEEMIGLKKGGEETEWSKIVKAAIANTPSGMFMVDFSRIMELDKIIG